LSVGRFGAPRVFATIGIAGLTMLGSAYWMTLEPAPSIRVRWRDEVTASRQADLERKYLLANGRAPQGRSIAYDLLDTRVANVRAIVEDPYVADTNDIDRDTYEVPFDTAYGDRWMWAAHRTPWLRDARVRWTLIVTLAAMTVVGVWGGSGRRRIAGAGGMSGRV
jgi:hypothetical protein